MQYNPWLFIPLILSYHLFSLSKSLYNVCSGALHLQSGPLKVTLVFSVSGRAARGADGSVHGDGHAPRHITLATLSSQRCAASTRL